jgi:hypothetical protein
MKKGIVALSFLSTLLVCAQADQNDVDAVRRRFLSEYPAALSAWESRCARSEGTYRLTEHDPKKKEASQREILAIFKCKLPAMSVLELTHTRNGALERAVSGYNDKYAFSLKKATEGGEYAVESLQPIRRPEDVPGNSLVRKMLRPVLWVPYAIPFSIDRMVSSPRFMVRAISPVSRNGKDMLRIEFDWPNDPSRKKPTRGKDTGGFEGFILVSPQEKWVLYEFECRQKSGAGRSGWRGSADYQGTVDGFPIPKRVAHQVLKLPEGDVVSSYAYDFLDFRFADVPDNEFTLARFGVPESVLEPAKVARNGRLGYWLAGLAVLAVLLAVCLKIVSSRAARVRLP